MSLSRLIGLGSLKSRLERVIVSCRVRNSVFPHTLLVGLGGCGKTTVARAICGELGYYFVEVEAAALRSREDIIRRLRAASIESERRGQSLLFFVDEVHRLSLDMQEVLYYPMIENRITTRNGDIVFGSFCLFAATTRRDMLDEGSFVSRFGQILEMGRYGIEDLESIVLGCFREWGIRIFAGEVNLISRRSLGIPRLAKGLSSKVRDQYIYRCEKEGGELRVLRSDLDIVFRLEGIDDCGLLVLHRSYLLALHEAGGKPRGLSMLSGRLGQNRMILEDTIEPVLLSLGFIDCTPRGRVITSAGQAHLFSQGMI